MADSAAEPRTTDTPVIYQHPLAYLLGLQGIALLRAFSGVHDRHFTLARFRDIQMLLDAAEELGEGVEARPIASREGYDRWAPFYDEPGNQLLDIEQPIVREIIDGFQPGAALDAACGTGRHAAHLAERGHRVIGVDTSPDMLQLARAKLPDAEFHQADFRDIPLPDNHVDVAVCALALTHVPDLAPVLTELVRVLKPGGHLVLSDSRPLINNVGIPLVRATPEGGAGYVLNQPRLASDYLAVALPLGLEVRRCDEPRRPSPLVDGTGTPPGDSEPVARHVAGDIPNIWALHPWCPDATNAAFRDTPAAIIWHFQLAVP